MELQTTTLGTSLPVSALEGALSAVSLARVTLDRGGDASHTG